ncbi:MAG: hypothetical protein NT030_03515 [Candidatus Saganbacteria bacterium]|nr:hypothetical protein [Candidatus Saganbacteria bacterium]
MKKLALALVIVFALSSVSFGALRAGKIGIEFENLLISDPLEYNQAYLTAMPALFYQFTEDLSAAIGLVYGNDPSGAGETDLAVKLKGTWNLGSGKTVPHLAGEIGYQSYQPGSGDGETCLQLAILYGVEALWLPGLSITLDARLIDYGSYDESGTSDTQTALLSGATLGIRWYLAGI